MSSRQRPRIPSKSASDVALAELEAIFDKLRSLLLTEYERGSAQAASRILSIVTTDSVANFDPKRMTTLVRAPRGAARELVEKALTDGAKTIREIRDTAQTDVEKFLSYQTVRLELERGRAAKRYKKTKDKWSLL